VALPLTCVTQSSGSPFSPCESATNGEHPKGGVNRMSILWIILIVVLVLALLGFFSRGYW
jgi:hypothetical protein